jgi:hypothetical protein
VITAASPATIFYGGTKAADTFTATGLNAADSISGITYTYRGTGSTSLWTNYRPLQLLPELIQLPHRLPPLSMQQVLRVFNYYLCRRLIYYL